MATYEEIYGKRVKDFDSDPTLDSSYEGQVWYNSSSGTLKTVTASIEAFSSTSSLNTARGSAAGAGTQTAALFNGGSPDTALCENYNGTGWTSIANLNTALQYAGGCGTETSALIYGDYPEANTTEEFNGSAWSAQEGFSTARRSGASFGLETAAVLAGGTTGPAVSTATEEYNGESWTGGGALSQARQYFAGTGIETAGLVFGGSSNPNTTLYTNTEEYNGSSWTNGGAMPAVRSMMFSWGTQTAGALSGGALPSTTNTCLKYDGTSWSSSPATMGTATKQGYTSGTGTTQSAGLCAGGDPAASRTEEFNKSINTITAAAWSSGGAYPTATEDMGSAGTRTAGLIFAGQTPAPGVTAATNEYDGSTFSGGGNVVDGRGFMTGFGTQTAAVGAGGAPSFTVNSESYDGSSWSEGNNMNTPKGNAMGAGTQTAGLIFGGYNGSSLTNTETYDGTSYSNNPNGLNTARRGSGGCGTQTAALCAGGYATNFTAVVEEYNGTSWSEVTNIPLARNTFRCVGTQTAALGSSGYLPGPQGGPGNLPTNSIIYDGTTWSTNPSLATGNNRGGQAGTTTASFVTGGSLGSGTTTENFDVGTETVTASTLTTS